MAHLLRSLASSAFGAAAQLAGVGATPHALTAGQAVKLSAVVIAAFNTVGFGTTAVTQSHKVTDLTGTSAFIASAWFTHAAACRAHGLALLAPSRSLLLAGCVTLWGVRLAGYLFYRVLKLGKDARLSQFFPKDAREPFLTGQSMYPVKLAGFWTAQSLWGWVVLLPIIVAQAVAPAAPLGVFGWAALGGFLTGFAMETVADAQKFAYKNKHPDRFVREGLFRYCRHPNYFGEMLLWTSLTALAGGPGVLAAYPWVAVSPAFTIFLLTQASGIPPLEEAHNKRYGSAM
ncbi:hypothetical protein WJX81_004958 [Elliptochloris bilobata]|uniref:Steroid 5-alpha reductase C-terminal domain-containing protein n=1 Tax=Elliptochloris bilobata TaxID=381761 RepID=A0AAW1QY46_9CHLO